MGGCLMVLRPKCRGLHSANAPQSINRRERAASQPRLAKRWMGAAAAHQSGRTRAIRTAVERGVRLGHPQVDAGRVMLAHPLDHRYDELLPDHLAPRLRCNPIETSSALPHRRARRTSSPSRPSRCRRERGTLPRPPIPGAHARTTPAGPALPPNVNRTRRARLREHGCAGRVLAPSPHSWLGQSLPRRAPPRG